MSGKIKAVMADSDLPLALLVGFDHGDSCTIGEHDQHDAECVEKASKRHDYSPTKDCLGCEPHEHWMILTMAQEVPGVGLYVVDADWGYHSMTEAVNVANAEQEDK